MSLTPRSPRRVPATRPAVSLLLLLLAALVLVTGLRCGGSASDEAAILASTGDLWAAPQRYEGRRVRTTGVVLGFNLGQADEHYVVEGPGQRRVELRGVDHERLAAMSGRRAEVIGRFHFTEDTGFGIAVDTIRVVG